MTSSSGVNGSGNDSHITSLKPKWNYITGIPDPFVYVAAGGMLSTALCGLFAYKNNGESSGKTFGLLSLASLAGIIPAAYYWLNPAKSREAEEFEKVRESTTPEFNEVKIDTASKTIVKEIGTIPLDMWKPEEHGEAYAYRWGGSTQGVKVKDHAEFTKTMEEAKRSEVKQKIESHREDIIDASIEHYKYKAKVKDHEIEILIPKIYADHRTDAVEVYLKGIEDSLRLPSSLLKLVKKIQFHLADNTDTEKQESDRLPSICAIDNGSINIGIEKFNFKAPSEPISQAENDEKLYILNNFLSPRFTELVLGRDNTPGSSLHHEIGHLFQYFMKRNCIGAKIPKEIFPEGSELREKDLTITETFGDSAVSKELIAFPDQTDEAELKEQALKWLNENKPKHDQVVSKNDENDAWLQVVKADKRHVSIYGLNKGEDFPETFSAFFMAILTKQTEKFKNAAPNRYAFLSHALKWFESISKPQNNS